MRVETESGDVVDVLLGMRLCSFCAVHDADMGPDDDVRFGVTRIILGELLALPVLYAVEPNTQLDFMTVFPKIDPVRWRRTNNNLVGYNADFGVTITMGFCNADDLSVFIDNYLLACACE
ncbi:hypothetical protein NUW54_g8564 [Trametes sanguinea]|uniref:Uncharacterized protein n=1 Tax=Trametes sanguinea TaxID=158606 RepID=A0ACC1PD05_9APHY|nr:hypothetical protein NUW54_g8564 [Trametes sanguinea]